MTDCIVFLGRCLWGSRVLGLELSLPGLSVMYIAEEVEVMVKEICMAVSKKERKLRGRIVAYRAG